MIVGSAAGFSPKILNWFINTKYKLIGGCLRITQFFSPHEGEPKKDIFKTFIFTYFQIVHSHCLMT